MIADFDEVWEFAAERLDEAEDGAEEIVFLEQLELAESMKNRAGGGFSVKASAITDVPKFKVLKHGKGQSVHAAILSVDLRQSGRRANAIGPEDTYLTMHTYIPTMAHLVEEAEGHVVGLRGDGLFAAFGLDDDGDEIGLGVGVQTAVSCGQGMIEATKEILNPILGDNGIRDDLGIGVGIAVGPVVITRIGLKAASEVTAYGDAVNQACKLSNHGENELKATKGAWDIFPRTKNGRITATLSSGSYLIQYPRGINELGGSEKRRNIGRPR